MRIKRHCLIVHTTYILDNKNILNYIGILKNINLEKNPRAHL